MTSFAHVDYPTQHPGVMRAERVAQSVRALTQSFRSARALPTFLLAAVVAALLVVASQVVDTWTDGHLLAAWIVLWTVAFATLALFAAPIARVSTGYRRWLKRSAAKLRQRAEDENLWRVALTDERVMADISRAMTTAAAVRNLKTYF